MKNYTACIELNLHCSTGQLDKQYGGQLENMTSWHSLRDIQGNLTSNMEAKLKT